MNKNVIMVIKKSASTEILNELIDEICNKKLLVRFMNDDDFDLMMSMYDKQVVDDALTEER